MTAHVSGRVVRDLAEIADNLRGVVADLEAVMPGDLNAAIADTARRAGNLKAAWSITALRENRIGALHHADRALRHISAYLGELEQVTKLLQADLPPGSLVVFTEGE